MPLSNQVLAHLVRTAAVIHRNGADAKFRREILINGYQWFPETFRKLCYLLFTQAIAIMPSKFQPSACCIISSFSWRATSII